MMHDMIRKPGRWIPLLAALALLVGLAGPAAAQTIEWLGPVFPHDITPDGKAIGGNIAAGYLPFRWTAETGIVLLDSTTVAPAGTPDISDDGNSISATIALNDSTNTFGIWTKGTGWQIPDPGVEASCWGMSGDGTTAAGFQWYAPSGITAHPATWSVAGGVTLLPVPVQNCRVNDTNYDGSIAVGWSERFDGVWLPTVWEDGGFTVLHDEGWFTEAQGILDDNNTIFGTALDTLSGHREAAIWVRNGSSWDQHTLGVLPGTFLGQGQAIPRDMTQDGNTMVGYNEFSHGNAEGFVWTLDQGMQSASDFMADEGFVLPTNYIVVEISGISANGKVFCGMGFTVGVFPAVWEAFVATRGAVAAVPGATVQNGLSIDSNHPNPFNPATTISLSLDRDQNVRLEIFDVRGRNVRVVHDGHLSAGNRELEWDGRDDSGRPAASGVYFARARGEKGASASHRMVLVK